MDYSKKQSQDSPFANTDSRFSKSLLYFIFIPALALVFIISIFSYRQVNKLVEANSWVTHTYQVIHSTDQILYSILNINSLQRGYLISGDDQFIANLDKAKANFKETFDTLIALTKDNPSQAERVTRIINLTNERLGQLNQTIQLKMNNKLNTQEGMDFFRREVSLSNQIKDLGQEIKSVELVLLNGRNDAALSDARLANSIIISGNIISICGLILVFFLANKELSRSQKAERDRKSVETRLRSILESATDMIAAVDNNYCYIIFNEAYQREFKRLFGKSIAIGMSLDTVFSDVGSKNKLLEMWKKSLNGGEFVKNIEFELENKRNVYEITSSLIINEDNEINGAVHIIRNITKQIEEQIELKDSYEKLNAGIQALQDKNEQITLLVEMSDIMLACSSQDELSHVMSKYCQRMLHFASGYLYVMHPSKNYLEIATTWGLPNHQSTTFPPDQCWAIRLGRIHHVRPTHNELICQHVKADDEHQIAYLCVPLMAQNDIYGLLYLEIKQETQVEFSENQRLLITAFSELTALAFANVRLRENLRYQSMRDPLTGLYNRRYLEDFLLKQVHQSERTKTPLSILMLDLDHFKKINDTYGHDAGDAALKELGKVLQDDIRVGDIAARYGGEEFIVVFYGTDAKTIKTRAESIRHAVSRLQIKYGAQHVGPITISIGISVYPLHGRTPTELIESADKALYFAKANGRNQVALYSDIENKKHL
ncbi:diguanylate cyclase [Legionella parisiensis]|uniref:diguanylate cyclase n=1 Tax=Legionella parisiensis TaxID=45071 RepID=A0A1E5JM11_9GAMM|nr:diguanylate cyclase [Legionella parisiensis]KTD42830.1 regulatory protein (GGDEF domain) [Legionella parisiensis]OEH45544.1 Diguanylate cyclase DosC [Legionella parisiensis]STX78096.1 regulatory protein (GGDEF domain) [Legionella parisiensis]